MFFGKNKKINSSKIFIFSLFILILLPLQQAKAWWGFGDTVVEVGENLFTNIETTIIDNWQWIKDNVLDAIAWAAANAALEHIADSTVDWINSGFEGSPMFMTDIGGFMEDVGDQALGEFIAGSPLAFLCSPFSLDVKIAISLEFGGKREAYCTLSEVFKNADNALNDLKNDWSWSKWGSISQSQNNAYGAYASAHAAIALKMAEEEDKEIMKSDWGGGFLEFEKCDPPKGQPKKTEKQCREVPKWGGGTEEVCKDVEIPRKCETKTPGKVIQDSLGDVLNVGNEKLAIADEINEIIGALLNQLIKSVFNSKEGLFGSNPGGENDENFSKIPSETVDDYKNHLTDLIQPESDYKGWKEQSLASVDLAKAYLLALIECWKGYTEPNPPPKPPIDKEKEIRDAQSIIENTIEPLQTRLTTEIETAKANILKIRALLTKIENNTDANGEVRSEIISEVQSDLHDLELHDKIDVVNAEAEYKGTDATTGIDYRMNNIIDQVLTDKVECTDGGGTFNEPSEGTPSQPVCTLNAYDATLLWTSTNATSGSINHEVGAVPESNLTQWSHTVNPSATTEYTGTVIGAEGENTCGPATVTVE